MLNAKLEAYQPDHMAPKKETKEAPKKNKRDTKAAEKSKAKKDTKSKTPSKGKKILRFCRNLVK